MPERRHAKAAAVSLLVLTLLLSSNAFALTLPNPPDKAAPANTQTGALPSSAQSFPGGVLLAKNGSADENVTGYEFAAEYFCYQHNNIFASKQFETLVGESISGPLSSAQTSGVIAALNSVRPPKTVTLSIGVGPQDDTANLTYVVRGMLYNVTTYSVWVTTQQSPPVEQRVGYIVVSVPEQPQVTMLNQFIDSNCSTPLAKVGAGFAWGSHPPPADPLGGISTPPQGGFSPILSYGTVKVLSGATVAGAASIKPGENVTFALPPGKYTAVADVALFGIPFAATLETYSSPAGATTAQFTVSLNNMYGLWYGVELTILIIIVAVLLILNERFHLCRALVHASKYSYRGLRSTWRRFWD